MRKYSKIILYKCFFKGLHDNAPVNILLNESEYSGKKSNHLRCFPQPTVPPEGDGCILRLPGNEEISVMQDEKVYFSYKLIFLLLDHVTFTFKFTAWNFNYDYTLSLPFLCSKAKIFIIRMHSANMSLKELLLLFILQETGSFNSGSRS